MDFDPTTNQPLANSGEMQLLGLPAPIIGPEDIAEVFFNAVDRLDDYQERYKNLPLVYKDEEQLLTAQINAMQKIRILEGAVTFLGDLVSDEASIQEVKDIVYGSNHNSYPQTDGNTN